MVSLVIVPTLESVPEDVMESEGLGAEEEAMSSMDH